MKTFWIGIVAAAMLCGFSLAQDATSPQTNAAPPQDQLNPATTQSESQSEPSNSAPANGFTRIAPGSVIPVQLTKTIDAKKAKTGDEVEARVTQDLKAQNGEIVVPKDTKVLGHVTEAQPRSKEQPESQVGIAFDRAVVKDRGDVPLPMSIQAIVAPQTSNSNNQAGADSAAEPANTPSPGGMPGNGTGRSGMAGAAPQMPASAASPGSAQGGANHQPITGTTQGVVGISNLKLETPANSTQGSLVSSEKNNVKLESGTFMLLRVNP